jgi:hypothetical protein
MSQNEPEMPLNPPIPRSEKHRSVRRWYGPGLAFLVVVVVVGIAAGGWWLQKMNNTTASATTQPVVLPLVSDRDYYFFVRLVEFNPTRPNGKPWDSVDGSAPDANVILYWKDNRIFNWTLRSDQLINTWDLFRVNVKDLITSRGQIDLSSVINAPLVRLSGNDSLRLEIWDDDPAFSDLAWNWEIRVSDLHEGKNVITPPRTSGIRRVEIDLIDRQTPLARLIEMESERN